MPCVALTNHKGAPASLGMMSSSRRQKTSSHQHLYLTLLMVCFSQVISSCRQVLCLPLEQPPPWCHSHTRAWVPAWDKRAPDLSPGVAGTPWKPQTLIFTFYFFTCVFPLPKVCSHYLLNISVNMPRKAFRPLSANHRATSSVIMQPSAFRGWTPLRQTFRWDTVAATDSWAVLLWIVHFCEVSVTLLLKAILLFCINGLTDKLKWLLWYHTWDQSCITAETSNLAASRLKGYRRFRFCWEFWNYLNFELLRE